MSKLKHLFLIDGSGFIFRAFHALPVAGFTRSDGTPTNAVFGFTNMLLSTIEDIQSRNGGGCAVAVVFDAARKTFRNDIYPDYKANRDAPPPELVPQFDIIKEAPRAFNLPSLEMPGYEADDLIATYARQAVEQGLDVTIVSSDKDLMQLVGGSVLMFDPMKNREIGPDQVREKFGVGPDRVVDVQALAGDASDNVPGVPGIGVKTAAQLINEYGDLDTLLARAGEIMQPKRREKLTDHAEDARISRQLVTLRDDVPLEEPLENLAFHPLEPGKLLAFLHQQEFRRIIARVERGYGRGNGDTAEPALTSGETPPKKETSEKKTHRAATHKTIGATRDYVLVRDEAALLDWIARAQKAGHVAVDTETTSLDPMTAQLVGVSLAIEPGAACYVPLAHRTAAAQGSLDLGDGEDGKKDKGGGKGGKDGLMADQIPHDKALALLAPLLENPSILKIGHNLKYDQAVFANYGVTVTPVDDTMLLSYVLECGLHGHGMDELAETELGLTTTKFKDVAGSGKSQVTFDLVELDTARDYAAEDADVTLQLYRAFKPRLAVEHMTALYETVERPLIPVLVAMEREGVRVDKDELERLSRDFATRLETLETEIHSLAGHEFAVGSPKQLGEVLFDEMGLPGSKKGKSGAYATGAEILEELAALGHDLPGRVLDWRQLAKLKSTYADALVREINPKTGRVHTSFSMAATSTGRLASSDPNLQNIPVRTEEGRHIRRAFVAAAGHKLLSVDYSQIELRLLAHVAGISVLKEAFAEGVDIHALTASQVFGVALKDMDGETRHRAKAINFGIIYGISPFGLARQLGITLGDAKAYMEAYFENYPGIRDYMEEMKSFCRKHGFVTTLFGRKCHIPEIASKNPARRNFAERAAINAPLQGAAADIIKRAMIRMHDALNRSNLKTRMLLQVHDELLFEVPEKEVDKATELAREVMEGACSPALTLSVPLVAEAGAAANWADAH